MSKRYILISITLVQSALMGCSDMVSDYPDLGSGYKFFHEGKHGISIVNAQGSQMVGSTVLEYDFDEVFIILSQRPWDSVPGIRSMRYSESNRAFENSEFRQYWIIDKIRESTFDKAKKGYSNVYGPYSKMEYLERREELGVSKDLKLEIDKEKKQEVGLNLETQVAHTNI